MIPCASEKNKAALDYMEPSWHLEDTMVPLHNMALFQAQVELAWVLLANNIVKLLAISPWSRGSQR